MALLNASELTGYSYNYAIPSGVSDPTIFTGNVDLILSTGITQQIVDTYFKHCSKMHSLHGSK